MTVRRLVTMAALIYSVAGLLLYSDVISNGLFLFDDFEYVAGNPLIQSFSPFTDMTDPRHIGYLSFALNYAIHGENPFGFHLVNVTIHIANALLVFLLAMLILGLALSGEKQPSPFTSAGLSFGNLSEFPAGLAFLAGLIFLVHPVETQAVSYITQRFTSLSTFFYLLSVYLYLEARLKLELGSGKMIARVLFGLSLASVALGMKTKEIAFTAPLMIAVIEILFFQGSRFRRKRYLFLAPYMAALVIIPLSLFGPEWGLLARGTGVDEVTRMDKIYDLTERSGYEYLLTQFRVIVTYVRLLLLPVNQQVVYDFSASRSFLEGGVIVSLMILLGMGAGGIYCWRKGDRAAQDEGAGFKLAAFGIAWFFVTLSVESSVIPIKDLIFEHRVYLPSAGFFWALSAFLVEGTKRVWIHRSDAVRLSVLALIIALPLSAATYVRNGVWTDEVKFWGDIVQKTGKAIGYNNRANAYAKLRKYDLALQDLDKTISFFPTSRSDTMAWENSDFTPMNMAKTYTNRGQIYLLIGEPERAQADFEMADKMRFMPFDIQKTLKMADRYSKQGAYTEAIEEYSKLLAWDPGNIEALNDRGNAFSYSKLYHDAIQDFDAVIALRPDYALAYHNRGIAYYWSGNRGGALADFKKACELGFQPSCESEGTLINDVKQ